MRKVNLEEVRERLAAINGSSHLLLIGIFVSIVIVFMIGTNSIASKREAGVANRVAELDQFSALASTYKSDMAEISQLRRKLFMNEAGVSTGALLEEIGAQVGIKKNISSFKPLEEGLVDGYLEKGVQIDIKGVTLNQAVNFLYKVREHKRLALIRNFSMKAHFANPALLDLSVQVVIVSKRASAK